MAKKRTAKRPTAPDVDTSSLYGRETDLIENHGAEAPGPDTEEFPVPADEGAADPKARPDGGESRPPRGRVTRRRPGSP